jgi:hypothetical protein
MTAVVNWRGDGRRAHFHLPLPEPPRHRHTSKSVPAPKDAEGRVLEDWLSSLTVTRTIDAD